MITMIDTQKYKIESSRHNKEVKKIWQDHNGYWKLVYAGTFKGLMIFIKALRLEQEKKQKKAFINDLNAIKNLKQPNFGAYR